MNPDVIVQLTADQLRAEIAHVRTQLARMGRNWSLARRAAWKDSARLCRLELERRGLDLEV